MQHISLLLGLADNHPETRSRVNAFKKGLRDLEWVEGRNIRIDYRFAGSDPNRIREYAAELVRMAPDLIVANSTPALTALRQATSTIPIVFMVVNDPVGQGFISSAAHPPDGSRICNGLGIMRQCLGELERPDRRFLTGNNGGNRTHGNPEHDRTPIRAQ